jgi:hypothetical protein
MQGSDAAVLVPHDQALRWLATFSLASKPYMEANVGIGNIFKLLRVDLVKRLTYLDNPDAPEWGIRARARLDF